MEMWTTSALGGNRGSGCWSLTFNVLALSHWHESAFSFDMIRLASIYYSQNSDLMANWLKHNIFLTQALNLFSVFSMKVKNEFKTRWHTGIGTTQNLEGYVRFRFSWKAPYPGSLCSVRAFWARACVAYRFHTPPNQCSHFWVGLRDIHLLSLQAGHQIFNMGLLF